MILIIVIIVGWIAGFLIARAWYKWKDWRRGENYEEEEKCIYNDLYN